jgi:hypothetical protein
MSQVKDLIGEYKEKKTYDNMLSYHVNKPGARELLVKSKHVTINESRPQASAKNLYECIIWLN